MLCIGFQTAVIGPAVKYWFFQNFGKFTEIPSSHDSQTQIRFLSRAAEEKKIFSLNVFHFFPFFFFFYFFRIIESPLLLLSDQQSRDGSQPQRNVGGLSCAWCHRYVEQVYNSLPTLCCYNHFSPRDNLMNKYYPTVIPFHQGLPVHIRKRYRIVADIVKADNQSMQSNIRAGIRWWRRFKLICIRWQMN